MYTNEFQNLSLSGLGMGCMRLPDLGKYSGRGPEHRGANGGLCHGAGRQLL